MSVKLRVKNLAKGKKSFYLDIYHNGEREYEFLKIYVEKSDPDRKEKKELAESIRAKRELEIKNGEYGFIPSFKKKADFIVYWQKFVDNYHKAGVRKFRYALEKFRLFYGKKKKLPFHKLTKKVCEQYKEFLISPASGLSGETPADYFKRFRTVLNEAVSDGILLKNPAHGVTVKIPKFQLKKEILTSEELQLLALTKCGNDQVKKAFLFACYTGLGEAEIRELTWSRIYNGKIKLFREKNGEQVINDLHPVALKLLSERGESGEKIFTLPSTNAVWKNLKYWKERANIEKKISFYCARHTFACLLLINGANLKTVADCMGHTSTQHTLKYLNYIDALKSEAISNLPEISI